MGRGLGSSAAAIIAGLSLCGRICGAKDLEDDLLLRIATELEGHPDNVAASLMGGWVTSCVKANGDVLALKRSWPADIKFVVVSPEVTLNTRNSRATLPEFVERADAVYNLQRAALLGGRSTREPMIIFGKRCRIVCIKRIVSLWCPASLMLWRRRACPASWASP
ncbi:MAG: hypothetical protein WKF84_15230 [Pyrinomonadaceae bacterium]